MPAAVLFVPLVDRARVSFGESLLLPVPGDTPEPDGGGGVEENREVDGRAQDGMERHDPLDDQVPGRVDRLGPVRTPCHVVVNRLLARLPSSKARQVGRGGLQVRGCRIMGADSSSVPLHPLNQVVVEGHDSAVLVSQEGGQLASEGSLSDASTGASDPDDAVSSGAERPGAESGEDNFAAPRPSQGRERVTDFLAEQVDDPLRRSRGARDRFPCRDHPANRPPFEVLEKPPGPGQDQGRRRQVPGHQGPRVPLDAEVGVVGSPRRPAGVEDEGAGQDRNPAQLSPSGRSVERRPARLWRVVIE